MYDIYPDGRIWSRHTNKFLHPTVDAHGYAAVVFSNNSQQKRHKIHRLVALKFIPNPKELPHINHKDGDKLNNDVNNLEWCSPKQNSEHAKNHGLLKRRGISRAELVKVIRQQFVGGETVKQIATRYGLSTNTVRNIVYGRVYRYFYPELISTWELKRPRHGTHSRYCKGCRCTKCRVAHAAYNRNLLLTKPFQSL